MRSFYLIVYLRFESLYCLITFLIILTHNCIAVFTKDGTYIYYKHKLIIVGKRGSKTGFYYITLPKKKEIQLSKFNNKLSRFNSKLSKFDSKLSRFDSSDNKLSKFESIKIQKTITKTTKNYTNHMLHMPTNNLYKPTMTKLIMYLHAACFSPLLYTWLKAIESGYFTTWPSLNTHNVKKYVTQSIATIKGHVQQQKCNIQSTKNYKHQCHYITNSETLTPIKEKQTNYVYMTPITTTGFIATDQTGPFPITSSQGARYILIMYVYDSNAILTEPLQSKYGHELLRGFKNIYQHIVSRGIHTTMHRLDNEAPQCLQSYLQSQNIDFQLVPPNFHRQNAAERAIKTFKAHFISGLSSIDPKFPVHVWCIFMEQATITLNLLHPSWLNPKLSAYAQHNGLFDYNCTPLAPPGTKTMIHVKPNQRAPWAPWE